MRSDSHFFTAGCTIRRSLDPLTSPDFRSGPVLHCCLSSCHPRQVYACICRDSEIPFAGLRKPLQNQCGELSYSPALSEPTVAPRAPKLRLDPRGTPKTGQRS